jgi:hypothetical protein
MKKRGQAGGFTHLDSMVNPVVEELYEKQKRD